MTRPEYNPTLNYEWKTDEIFPLLGTELEYLFKTINEFLLRPESQHVLRMAELLKILQVKLTDGVVAGTVSTSERRNDAVKGST